VTGLLRFRVHVSHRGRSTARYSGPTLSGSLLRVAECIDRRIESDLSFSREEMHGSSTDAVLEFALSGTSG